MTAQKKKVKIITFYSYKGGDGAVDGPRPRGVGAGL